MTSIAYFFQIKTKCMYLQLAPFAVKKSNEQIVASENTQMQTLVNNRHTKMLIRLKVHGGCGIGNQCCKQFDTSKDPMNE